MQNIGRTINDFLNDGQHHRVEPETANHIDATQGFIEATVIPAFEEVRARLGQDGREVRIANQLTSARLDVLNAGQPEFSYAVSSQIGALRALPGFQTTGANGGRSPAGTGEVQAEQAGDQETHVSHVTREEMVRQILRAYEAERAQRGV